jgi:hypothetical protein
VDPDACVPNFHETLLLVDSDDGALVELLTLVGGGEDDA